MSYISHECAPETHTCSPGLLSFGSPLALEDIQSEASTWDGPVYDILDNDVPDIVNGALIRAADGLKFETRDALYVGSSHLWLNLA